MVVVHAEGSEQALRNVSIAHDAGADGVFLINHRIKSVALSDIYRLARRKYPDWWIGLNFLDLENTSAVMAVPSDASALWVDNALIDENEPDPVVFTRIIRVQQNQRTDWHGLYFAGIDFKYQKKAKNLRMVAQLARPLVDVITTSGDATGQPPSVEKIRVIRDAIGDHPLAIASGISTENVHQFLGMVDYGLVATSISKNHSELDHKSELDPKKVRELSMIIHGEK